MAAPLSFAARLWRGQCRFISHKKDILYVDKDIIAINKRAGITTQGEENSFVTQLSKFRFENDVDPRIIHRLDRDTTGVLLLARNDDALRRMNDLFASGAIKKTYLAVVMGLPNPLAGTVTSDLSKARRGRQWVVTASDAAHAATATTSYRVVSHRGIHAALVELKPLTGRQHQLRVHCADMLQAPILGDPLYGPGVSPWMQAELRPSMPVIPLHLHAFEIVLPDGFTKDGPRGPVALRAPLPTHFKVAVNALGLAAPAAAAMPAPHHA